MKSIIKFRHPLIAIFAFALSLAACNRESSGDVKQNRIWSDYTLEYDGSVEKTTASAVFRFGGATGTQLELSNGSTVSFRGQTMDFKPLLAFYQLELSGKQDTGSFVFKDADGLVFTNSVALPPTAATPASVTEISRGADFTLTWFGDPIVAGDAVIVTLVSVVNAKTEVFTTANVGATSLTLPSSKLSLFPNGGAKISISRERKTLSGDFEDEGGVITTRSKGLNRTVNLKD